MIDCILQTFFTWLKTFKIIVREIRVQEPGLPRDFAVGLDEEKTAGTGPRDVHEMLRVLFLVYQLVLPRVLSQTMPVNAIRPDTLVQDHVKDRSVVIRPGKGTTAVF